MGVARVFVRILRGLEGRFLLGVRRAVGRRTDVVSLCLREEGLVVFVFLRLLILMIYL